MDTQTTISDVIKRAKKITLLILDVDGVLSDGKLYFSNSGEEIKAFNSLDGHGIKMLQKHGVEVAIITGRTSHIVEKRARDLGITHLLQGREDKRTALNELIADTSHDKVHIAHMGDDYPDIAVMMQIGLALAPANAHWAVKKHAHWHSQFNGGDGAVREACDMIMMAQGTFYTALSEYTA